MWLEMGGSCIFQTNCFALCWFLFFSDSKTWNYIPDLWHDSSTVENNVPTTWKKKSSNVKSKLFISSIEFVWYKINLKPASCFIYVPDDWLQALTVIHFWCWICFFECHSVQLWVVSLMLQRNMLPLSSGLTWGDRSTVFVWNDDSVALFCNVPSSKNRRNNVGNDIQKHVFCTSTAFL